MVLWVPTVVNPILQMGKLRLREGEQLAQSYLARQGTLWYELRCVCLHTHEATHPRSPFLSMTATSPQAVETSVGIKVAHWGNSLVVQWLRLCASNAGGPGLISVPHAMWSKEKRNASLRKFHELRLEAGEGTSHGNIWGTGVPGREKSTPKGPLPGA